MSCDTIDLKAYQLGEAGRDEAARVCEHLAACAGCREELERLELTRTLLMAAPEEPMPHRIAFVSDKIFEPRWWQRLLKPSPVWGLVSAMMLVSAVGLNVIYRPEPVVVPHVTRATPQEINAQIEVEVARRVAAEVKQALAESEARQAKVWKATIERMELDHKAELLQVREEMEVLGKRVNTLRVLSARADVGELR
jgi:anti-sigma factor RsiW